MVLKATQIVGHYSNKVISTAGAIHISVVAPNRNGCQVQFHTFWPQHDLPTDWRLIK